MMEPEPTLQPFEEVVQAKAESLRRKARRENLRASFKRPLLRVSRTRVSAGLLRARLRGRRVLHEMHVKARRASFEVGAAAQSSATLSGVSKDAERVGAALRGALPKDSATLHGLREDLARAGRFLDAGATRLAEGASRAGRRLKAALLRSSTVSGLAIDSRRVAKRVRHGRPHRRGRFAH